MILKSIPINYTLKSPNYWLRIPSQSDIDFVFDASRFPGFNDGMLWDPPENISELEAALQKTIKSWEKGKGYSFTILSKVNNQRLGRISIRKVNAEETWNIGFWTHPKSQSKGVMSETLASIVELGFEVLGATKITAHHAVWNKASEKVLLNNGFKFAKYIKKGFQKNGKWVSENEMQLLKIDYVHSQRNEKK